MNKSIYRSLEIGPMKIMDYLRKNFNTLYLFLDTFLLLTSVIWILCMIVPLSIVIINGSPKEILTIIKRNIYTPKIILVCIALVYSYFRIKQWKGYIQ